jgi:general secretion pathway protein H
MPQSSDSKVSRGFTLAEILVVLVIVALVTAVTLLRTTNISSTKSVERFANQLHSYLSVVQEQAILKPGVFGLFLSEQGYSVLELNTEENTWDLASERHSSFWRPKSIAHDIQIALTINSQPSQVPSELSQVIEPQIVFLPSGEITPFNMILHGEDHRLAFRLSGNYGGALVVDKVER